MRSWLRWAAVLALAAGIGCAGRGAGPDTDRFRLEARATRDRLAASLPDGPFCFAGLWWHGSTVTLATPSALRAGVQPGDTILQVAGWSFEPQAAGSEEIWSRWEKTHKPGERVTLTVARGRQTSHVQLVCRDARPLASRILALYTAQAEGRWRDCIDLAYRAEAFGGPIAALAMRRVECFDRLARESRMTPLLAREGTHYRYELVDRVLTEHRHLPGGPEPEVIAMAKRTIDGFERAGYHEYAERLSRKLARAEPAAPTAPAAPAQAGEASPFESFGSCFAIDAAGGVVTAHHVVAGASRIEVTDSHGTVHEAWVEGAAPELDLVVLRLESRTPDHLELAPPGPRAVGTRLFTVGYPVANPIDKGSQYSEGTVQGRDEETGFLLTSIPSRPGSDGGPVLDTAGRALGVVVSVSEVPSLRRRIEGKAEYRTWSADLEFVRSFVAEVDPRPPAANRREAVDRGRAAACSVRAWR